MSTNGPMTQERLDALRELVESMWNMDPHSLAAYAREHFPVMLTEVERLRALTTVDDDMVERAVKAHRETFNAWHVKRSLEDAENRRVAAMRAALDAALGTGEKA